MDDKKRKKVLVAMSGGVDSSLAAALLQKQGYKVLGIFLRLWKNSKGGYEQDRKNLNDAQKVAKKLGIELKIVDARSKFRNKVVGYFLDSYKKGETPNPCVFCNKNLKFKILLNELKKEKADFVATGHYALLRPHPPTPSPRGRGWTEGSGEGNSRLYEARDKTKDQSYFLYTLNQKDLSKIIFPLGDIKKEEARKIAKKLDLHISEKKESQDVCFLENEEVSNFLKKNLHLEKGKIIDEKGNILGNHAGLPLYTLGQRKGIGVGGKGPYFVFDKDKRRNELKITNLRNKELLKTKEFFLEKINWIVKNPPKNKEILLRTRYHNRLVSAIIKRSKAKTRVILSEPQKAITPGQSAVFYGSRGLVLGGGIIKK